LAVGKTHGLEPAVLELGSGEICATHRRQPEQAAFEAAFRQVEVIQGDTRRELSLGEGSTCRQFVLFDRGVGGLLCCHPGQPLNRWPPFLQSFRISVWKASPWPGRSGGLMVPSLDGSTGSIQRSSFQSMYSR